MAILLFINTKMAVKVKGQGHYQNLHTPRV